MAGRSLALSLFVLVAAAGALLHAQALNNGVGRTPAMGWNSWNYFRCNISESVIREVADAIVSSGLKDAGYQYVNVDDCWMQKRDPETRRIIPFADKFPSGMKALADYVHSKGLKFGVYSDTGNHTCEGYPGSWGHEKIDAETYAEWGVDYLKYDYCDMDKAHETVQQSYERMRDALASTGRPILFSLCSWGSGQPWLWGKDVGNSWRTGIDLFAVWDQETAKRLKLPSFLQPVLGAVRQTQTLAQHASPGAFNDPDMLVVGLDGMYPYGIVQECPEHIRNCKPGEYISRDRWGKVGGLTKTEQRAHFAMWCMMASPLILGNDPRHMSKFTLQTLTAREVLSVNQDPLGAQGAPVWSDAQRKLEVWTKPLADGRIAMLLLNLGDTTADVTTVFTRDMPDAAKKWARDVPGADPVCVDKAEGCKGWAAGGECTKNPGFMLDTCPGSCPEGCPKPLDPPGPKATALVRDLWEEEDVGIFTARFTAAKVEPHEGRLVTLRWIEPAEMKQLEGRLEQGSRALAKSVRAAAAALKLGLAPGEGGEEGGKGGAGRRGKGGGEQGHFIRAKELETEVQRLHNEVKKRDRQIAALQKELDEVSCGIGGHGDAASADADAARRSARATGGEGVVASGAGAGQGVWLGATESKVSLGLNLMMAGMLVLLVLRTKRRAPKASAHLQ